MKHRTWLLMVTALLETATGFALLITPLLALELLLGLKQAAPEATFITRLAGAALLAIGVICYLARNDQGSPALLGVHAGILIYNVGAAVLLAYAGISLNMIGILLWPAVALHAALTIWCVACLRGKEQPDQGTLRS